MAISVTGISTLPGLTPGSGLDSGHGLLHDPSYFRQQGGTQSPVLYEIETRLLALTDALTFRHLCCHIPGCRTTLRDHLSRKGQPIPVESPLCPRVRYSLELWGSAPGRLLHDQLYQGLPQFFSPHPGRDNSRRRRDGAQLTGRESLHDSPFPLRPAALRKLNRPHGPVFPVMPASTGAAWFLPVLRTLGLPRTERFLLPHAGTCLLNP